METKKYLIKEINGKFSVIKEGNQRASKVFTTMIDAGDWVHEQGAELIVEDMGCGCTECSCNKDVENVVDSNEECTPVLNSINNNTNWESVAKTAVPADEWLKKSDAVRIDYYPTVSFPLPENKPTFIEKVKGLFSNLFK
jgi:hypothetical protein